MVTGGFIWVDVGNSLLMVGWRATLIGVEDTSCFAEVVDCPMGTVFDDEGWVVFAVGVVFELEVDGFTSCADKQVPYTLRHPSPQYVALDPQNPPAEQQFPNSLPWQVKANPSLTPQSPVKLIDASPPDDVHVPKSDWHPAWQCAVVEPQNPFCEQQSPSPDFKHVALFPELAPQRPSLPLTGFCGNRGRREYLVTCLVDWHIGIWGWTAYRDRSSTTTSAKDTGNAAKIE